MLIFIFQTIWLFIDDLAGRGLDIFIIGKFLFYIMPNLSEKVIPLTVLLASILTFGSLAENYEFAAMKASGISLQRSMLSIILFVSFLGVIVFYFANSVIPASEQKLYNLRRNIGQVKPSTAIIAGAFSDLDGTDMNMKVDRKYGENERYLDNVIIHRKSKNSLNNTVIKAKTGELISSEGSNMLQLVLIDGHYYEDVIKKSVKEKRTYPFAKSTFEVYTINQDISKLDVDLDHDRAVTTDKMKNVLRLIQDADSIKKNNITILQTFSKSIYTRMGAFPAIAPKDNLDIVRKVLVSNDSLKTTSKFMVSNDSLKAESKIAVSNVSLKAEGKIVVPNDSLKAESKIAFSNDSLKAESKIAVSNDSLKAESRFIVSKDSILVHKKNMDTLNLVNLFPSYQKPQILNSALNTTNTVLNSISNKKNEIDKRYKIYNMHIVSLHKKFALALSCIILFFVGAPLGAIIRKGGLGLPMVIAIVLFLTYYFIGVFAENYAKEGNMHPIIGAWASTLIMLPLGIFLTQRATADKGFVDFGSSIAFFKNAFVKFRTTTK